MAQKKYFLFKESDGMRGQKGKQKIYLVTVDGVTVVTEWGMAEKGVRQYNTIRYYSPLAALQNAQEVVRAKMQKGYRLAAQV